MTTAPRFDTRFEPRHGEAVTVAPGVQRITAPNAGPFTFHGTNSYIIGEASVAVLDPGPMDERHFAALTAALEGRRVSHILVSHTHIDHSPLAARLAAATGAPVLAEGPHRLARPLFAGETNPLAESCDADFRPDVALADGDPVFGEGWTLKAIHTPGHAANHLAFALEGTGIVFSGDHVMAWATSVVAPPDGAMRDYMASLDRLASRKDRLYLPGHGGPVDEPGSFVRALRAHRRMRSQAIVERLASGDRSIAAIVKALYRDTDPRLHGAAALSVLAHLEDLVEQGVVASDGRPALSGAYRLSDRQGQ